MTETLCSSGAVKLKAGSGATILSGADYITFISYAEGVIAAATRNDYVADYAAISANTRSILDDTASSLAAISVINNDLTAGGINRIEMEDRINVNRDIALRNLSILRDKKVEEFLT